MAGLSPSSMTQVPIYTPERRETKWSKVLCLRKRRAGLEPRTSSSGLRGVFEVSPLSDRKVPIEWLRGEGWKPLRRK